MSGMDKVPYQQFARQQLGLEFNNIDLLITALTHRSYLNEHRKSATEHNERLEFLGDAVLELVITDYLYRHFNDPEGILTAWRSALVRTESIAAAGVRLGYESLVRMSRGERHGTERARQQILANAFEAVVGAIYLEHGYEAARDLIYRQIVPTLADILKTGSWRDPKSHIQELMQRVDNTTPSYQVISETGPDHDKLFTVALLSGDKLISQGQGSSKQAAQQEAARLAIDIYRQQNKL